MKRLKQDGKGGPRAIAPASGKLGVLIPGAGGAVATTLIAGVHLINKGLAKPYGSLTQMERIRLGKRSRPLWKGINALVPLADVGDLVFGGWDIFPDDGERPLPARQGLVRIDRGLPSAEGGPSDH